uniref:DUF4371 domain-containing protein n=1 Tax=Hucho hucho TaxID=62062 RepID=A0A4W5QK15_9TELE
TFKLYNRHGNYAQILTSAHASDIAERREYLRRIVAVTSMLGRQGLSFCANDESSESTNRGNFFECMELLKEFDPFLQRYNTPSNATYLSPESQNDMIECCAQEIINTMVSEMSKSGMYAIMADEARDGQSEQLALCVRYVTEGTVKECLLALLQMRGVAGLKCVAQTYDGAAVTSGSKVGVQAHFRVLHPEAIYVHCYAHELNLVLCHTCRAIPEAAEFFSFLENVYSFFSTSLVNHHKFKEAQSKLGIASAELVQLSNTRWACQLRSINAVLDTLTAIFDCLSAIGSPMAVGLRAKFSTVYLLLTFQSLLSVTEGLHKFLQKETVDLAEACFGKQAVCDTLIDKCTDAFATELFDRTKALCEVHNFPEANAARKRKQRKMGDFVVETSLGLGTELSCSQTKKTELLLPCLDRMVCELDQRFSTVDAGLLKGIQACSPNSKNFLDTSCLTEFAKHYSIDVKTEEMLVARNLLAWKRGNHSGCPHNSCEQLHSWLRKTMGQKSLASLAAMSIEGEVLGRFGGFKTNPRGVCPDCPKRGLAPISMNL